MSLKTTNQSQKLQIQRLSRKVDNIISKLQRSRGQTKKNLYCRT